LQWQIVVVVVNINGQSTAAQQPQSITSIFSSIEFWQVNLEFHRRGTGRISWILLLLLVIYTTTAVVYRCIKTEKQVSTIYLNTVFLSRT